jgi:O-antigen ligase
VLLLYGLLQSRPLLWLELAVGAGGLLFAWATGGVDRLLAVDTFRNRVEQWGNTWELVRERPLRGLGLDAYYHHYHRRFPDLVEAYWTPHNVVLEFWTRLGVLGLAVGAWLYGAFFLHAGRLYRRLKGPVGRVLTLGLLGSVAYALAHGLLDGAFFAPDWAATFWLAYGLVAVLREDDTT